MDTPEIEKELSRPEWVVVYAATALIIILAWVIDLGFWLMAPQVSDRPRNSRQICRYVAGPRPETPACEIRVRVAMLVIIGLPLFSVWSLACFHTERNCLLASSWWGEVLAGLLARFN